MPLRVGVTNKQKLVRENLPYTLYTYIIVCWSVFYVKVSTSKRSYALLTSSRSNAPLFLTSRILRQNVYTEIHHYLKPSISCSKARIYCTSNRPGETPFNHNEIGGAFYQSGTLYTVFSGQRYDILQVKKCQIVERHLFSYLVV